MIKEVLTGKKVNRRTFLKESVKGVSAFFAGTVLFKNNVAFAEPIDSPAKTSDSPTDEFVKELIAEIPHHQNLEHDADHNEGMKAGWIDYLGAFLFAKGVNELLPKGRGHIGATEYASLAALIGLKYEMGDEETRKHIKDELKASLQAFAIILGSSIGAQGLKADIEHAYKEASGETAKLEDKVALVTMASSLISPLATTVSASAALTEEAQSISREVWSRKNNDQKAGEKDLDHPTVAALIDHVANGSGFLLFGDPPFIAMIEKFGFAEAVSYQAKTMWPMAILSLISANVKINEEIIKSENKNIGALALKKEALTRSVDALRRNTPMMAKMIGKSLENVRRYATGVEQNPAGFELSILEVLDKKIMNLGEFLLKEDSFKFPLHDPEAYGGLTQDHLERLEAEEEFVEQVIEKGLEGSVDQIKLHTEITHFLDHEDYDGLENWLAENHGQQAIYLVEALRSIAHDRADNFISSSRSGLSQRLEQLLPVRAARIYKRLSTHRFHNAEGAQISDVANVFPFQAGSVMFLSPIFQDLFGAIQRGIAGDSELSVSKDVALDAAVYASIEKFSNVADNYVAAKLGLEFNPKKAALVLIAAIRGGVGLSPLSNMADPTLIPMHLYGLKDSFNQLKKGAGAVQTFVSGFAYSQIIDKLFIPNGMFIPPTPTTTAAH